MVFLIIVKKEIYSDKIHIYYFEVISELKIP